MNLFNSIRKLFLLLCLIIEIKAGAQRESPAHFIGINPSITVEPFYSRGELDINIFPLTYQRTLGKRTDIRATAILNLGIRNGKNALSHFGLETAMPVFLKKKMNESAPSSGFFISPVLSWTRNRMAAHHNSGIWLEPGYHLLFDNRFAMSFGLQIGGTYFRYDNGSNRWGSHFGVKIILGKWL
jgi:hypothetical protein